MASTQSLFPKAIKLFEQRDPEKKSLEKRFDRSIRGCARSICFE